MVGIVVGGRKKKIEMNQKQNVCNTYSQLSVREIMDLNFSEITMKITFWFTLLIKKSKRQFTEKAINESSNQLEKSKSY